MKRLAGVLLLCAAALFSACNTAGSSRANSAAIDLPGEVNRLRDLYREAVRVPLTPQIVEQVRKDNRAYLLGEIRYFSSVNIALMNSRTGDSSLDVETKELPRVRRVQPAQDSQTASAAQTSRSAQARNSGTSQNPGNGRLAQDSGESPAQESPLSVTVQEIGVLTFREGGSFLNQRRITSDEEGHLKSLSPGGDEFEIHFPARGITLGFVLNQEENWYDLEFALDEITGQRTPLAMTGIRPHLMIYYQTVFPSGETRIQMDRALEPSSSVPGAVPEDNLPPQVPGYDYQPEIVPPEEAAGLDEEPPVPSFAGDWEPYSQEGWEEGDLGPVISLERAPPTPWEDGDDMFSCQGEDLVEIDVVLAVEKAAPPAPDFPTERFYSGEGGVSPGYIIQVGAFREKRNAAAAFTALERAGFCPFYEDYQDLTRVLIPAVEGGDLVRVKEKIKTLGFGEPYVRR
jgi:hypothetical protein